MYYGRYVELSFDTGLGDLLELLERKTGAELEDLFLALLLVDD